MDYFYRKTYAEIDLKSLNSNVKKLVKNLDKYEYKIAAVKAESYGHYGTLPIKCMLGSGINYLATATLEEALEIRKEFKNVPILCLGIIPVEYLDICAKKNITITVSNVEYVKKMKPLKKLKTHIKINSGMNRLGVKTETDLKEIINILKKNNIVIEGIFTHIYNDENKKDTLNQIILFEKITKNINLNDFKIVHFGASGYALNYPKLSYVNGIRVGRAMYGWGIKSSKSTFSLVSHVIQINDVENEKIGYNGIYKAKKLEKIAVVPIGYADGIPRHITGFYVYINNKKYPIVGNICMDMLFIRVDDSVKVDDKVFLIKNNDHLKSLANHLETIDYEVICMISKRVPRVYKY